MYVALLITEAFAGLTDTYDTRTCAAVSRGVGCESGIVAGIRGVTAPMRCLHRRAVYVA